MGFHHHGGDNPANPANDLAFANLLKRFEEQVEGRAKRAYSEGRISSTDEGELACAIKSDRKHGRVIVDFGKPVTWLGMTPQDAVSWAQALINCAKEISKEPIVLELKGRD